MRSLNISSEKSEDGTDTVVVMKSFQDPDDAWDFLEAISYSEWDEIGIRRVGIAFQVYAKKVEDYG